MREELYTMVDDEDGDYDRWTVNCWLDNEGNYHVDECAPRVRCKALLEAELEYRQGDTYERTTSQLPQSDGSASTP